MGREPEPAILWLEKPSMLLHAIAVALVVGTIAVPLCLFRFVYRFAKKPATPAGADSFQHRDVLRLIKRGSFSGNAWHYNTYISA